MNANDYAAVMIEAQRAAFNALRSTTPMFNTVGAGGIMLIEESASKDAERKISQCSRFEEVDRRQRNKERIAKIDKSIPIELRLSATYTPIIIRELCLWICNQAARLLKESEVKFSKEAARKLKEDASDYTKIWLYEYDQRSRDSIVWLMKDWITESLGPHVEMLKNSYLYVVNNGNGPKYRDANTRDLIAWLYTVCALSEEIILFDIEKIKEINKKIGDSMPHVTTKSRKDDFTYAFSDYAESMLDKFGYRKGWRCSNVDLSRKVIRTQMRLYRPKPRIDEFNRLCELEEQISNISTIKLQ